VKPVDVAALRKELGFKPAADPLAERVMNESMHQQALFRWSEYAAAMHPELRWLHSVPNGGFRTKATAGKMRGEGQKAGVPDVFLDVARQGFHGLRIELKTPRIPGVKGVRLTVQPGQLSAEQKAWLEHYRTGGYCARVAYGWLEAKDIILNYLQKDEPCSPSLDR
jgi:hypothetical protein